MKNAEFEIVENDPYYLIIRDTGHARGCLSVTNDVDTVIEALKTRLAERRLFYYDSDNRLDEIIIDDNGRFAYFAPGGPRR